MDFGGFFKPKDSNTHQNSSAANIPCAIPVLNQVVSATRGATDAFSGVGRHVNDSLRKLGAKNIEGGIGCGVGFGHGFGAGLGVKPGLVHQIQSSLVQAVTKMMVKFGMFPNLSFGQGLIPASLQSGMMPSIQNPMGSIMQLASKVRDHTSQGLPTDGNLSAGHLQSENNMLQMVLKHQQVIEELMKENEKLRKMLVEDLKIPPSKLQASYSSSSSPCDDCFECRRKQRKK